MKNTVIIICLLMFEIPVFAQSNLLAERRWLILLTKEEQHPHFQEQVEIITANRAAAIERKIAILQVTTKGTKAIFNSTAKTTGIAETFNNTRSKDTDFEVILLGLDGTIKLRRKLPVEADELFNLIDSMPMRQEEIQRQKREERLEKEREQARRDNR